MPNQTPLNIRVSYWFTTNRVLVRKIGHGIAIGLVACIWLVAIVNAIQYLSEYSATQRAYEELQVVSAIYDTLEAPRNLRVLDSGIVNSATGVYDAYALIENPNDYHAVGFSYAITVAGQQAISEDGFAKPNEQVYVVARDFSANEIPSTPDVSIEDTTWHRIRGQQLTIDFSDTETSLVPISVEEARAIEETTDRTGVSTIENTNDNVNNNDNDNSNDNVNNTNNSNDNENENTNSTSEFLTPDDVLDEEIDEPGRDANYTRLNSILNNNSALGYKYAQVIIIMRDSTDEIVGVHKQVLRNFESFSQLPLSVVWARRFTIDVIPEIHIYTDYITRDNLIYPGE